MLRFTQPLVDAFLNFNVIHIKITRVMWCLVSQIGTLVGLRLTNQPICCQPTMMKSVTGDI